MKSNEGLTGSRFELALGDEGYPPLLAMIPDPPERIYGIGDACALQPGVAVIGARKATPYGLGCTERFAAALARRGLPIIAGGARGCDLAAHRTALKFDAPTIVVFGSGADVVYPKQGRKTFQQAIDAGGAVISEQPWGMPPLPSLFPQRNRIIAGLSILLVIAEAGLPSGTFTTADAALAQGKDVAVVPGAITSPNSRGCNRLLSQGAIPLVDEDVLEEALKDAFVRCPVSHASCDDDRIDAAGFDALLDKDPILRALSAEGYRPSELCAFFGFSAAELASRLSAYEMQGLIERGIDGRYHLRPGAVCLPT